MKRMYEYHCPECNQISEKLVEEDNRKDPQLCNFCEGLANYIISKPHLDYLHMGVDAVGNPTAGEKWARMHEEQAKKERKQNQGT